ncbi:hypothetical protein [Actinomadura xylanilytica]|uniref:hypothetical protein n=1 Tax=Actinomadura xylanilytica TaxID=887459 RepID=UPI00255B3E83|nr:hypothetical protein [Actinomadura xylanilytica]MDL4770680.1 hypothetical protein [Actinomadura xylanilytica]
MTASIDDLVAGLATVRDEELTSGPGARELLAAITAERPEAVRAPRPRYARLLPAGAAATALAAMALVALTGAGPEPVRTYANAAVAIEHKGEVYEVRVKDAYADQREFAEAFAKLGLNVRLSIVPVSPRSERRVLSFGGTAEGDDRQMPTGGRTREVDVTPFTCPPAGACPLTLRLSGDVHSPMEVTLGRRARPGEVYADDPPQQGDPLKRLKLRGLTVADALARLRGNGLGAVYEIGSFTPGGSGSWFTPAPSWRPAPGRRVTGAWLHSSQVATLMVSPAEGDPQPTPTG